MHVVIKNNCFCQAFTFVHNRPSARLVSLSRTRKNRPITRTHTRITFSNRTNHAQLFFLLHHYVLFLLPHLFCLTSPDMTSSLISCPHIPPYSREFKAEDQISSKVWFETNELIKSILYSSYSVESIIQRLYSIVRSACDAMGCAHTSATHNSSFVSPFSLNL